jgi:Putative peptidoglycan binding domain
MPTQHTIKQGEHISSIAERYGFEDYKLIWNHPDNAELKKLRENPHVLFPGDTISVLDKELKVVDAATGKKHTYKVKLHALKLRVKLLNLAADPVKDTPCKLSLDSAAEEELTTDGDGLVEKPIARSAKLAKLVVNDADFSMKIGHLNPIAEGDPVADDPANVDSGWEQRLNNLGYVVPPADDRDDDELRSAIEEFQCDHGMKAKGEKDAPTRSKLVEIHGS